MNDKDRCLCGHYRREHDTQPFRGSSGAVLVPAGRCSGAYATLAADADDNESVEVACSCQSFSGAEPNYHESRS